MGRRCVLLPLLLKAPEYGLLFIYGVRLTDCPLPYFRAIGVGHRASSPQVNVLSLGLATTLLPTTSFKSQPVFSFRSSRSRGQGSGERPSSGLRKGPRQGDGHTYPWFTGPTVLPSSRHRKLVPRVPLTLFALRRSLVKEAGAAGCSWCQSTPERQLQSLDALQRRFPFGLVSSLSPLSPFVRLWLVSG